MDAAATTGATGRAVAAMDEATVAEIATGETDAATVTAAMAGAAGTVMAAADVTTGLRAVTFRVTAGAPGPAAQVPVQPDAYRPIPAQAAVIATGATAEEIAAGAVDVVTAEAGHPTSEPPLLSRAIRVRAATHGAAAVAARRSLVAAHPL